MGPGEGPTGGGARSQWCEPEAIRSGPVLVKAAPKAAAAVARTNRRRVWGRLGWAGRLELPFGLLSAAMNWSLKRSFGAPAAVRAVFGLQQQNFF